MAVSAVAAPAAPTAAALDEKAEEAAVAKETTRKKLQKFSKDRRRRPSSFKNLQDFKISRFDLLERIGIGLCGRSFWSAQVIV